MDKKIVLLIMAAAFFVFTGTAMAQLSTTTHTNIENLTNSLTEDAKDLAKEKIEDAMDGATQVIGNEVSEVTQSIIKKIPSKALDILKTVSSKTLDFVRGSINDDMREWFGRRKMAVIEGLREEKEEFGGSIKEILSNIWEKIKDVFKKNIEETTEELKE